MNRNFWVLSLGQAISLLGSGFGQVAQAWLVYELTGSKLAMGTVVLLGMVPETLLRLFGSPLIDRFNRVKLLRGMDLTQALLYAAPALLASAGLLQLWHLYAFAILAGLSRALYVPTYFALMPSVVPPEALVRANSLGQTLTNGISLLGPAIAGALVASVGAAPALAVDAASYAFSATALLLIPAALGKVEAKSGPVVKYTKQLADGLSLYRQMPALLIVLIAAAAFNLAIAATNAMLVPLVRERIGADAQVVGAMTSSFTGGMFIGGLVLGWIGDLKRRRISMMLPLLAGGLGMAGLSLVSQGDAIAAIALWGFVGLGTGLFNPQNASLYQRLVPNAMAGRVMAVRLTIVWGVLPLGSFFGSLVAERAGLPTMLLTFGLIPVLITIPAMLGRSLRAIDGDLQPPAEPLKSAA